jgi:hypothetical protein
MALAAPDRAHLKAEHAVRLLRPFMGTILAKPGESFLRHYFTSDLWKIWRGRSK